MNAAEVVIREVQGNGGFQVRLANYLRTLNRRREPQGLFFLTSTSSDRPMSFLCELVNLGGVFQCLRASSINGSKRR